MLLKCHLLRYLQKFEGVGFPAQFAAEGIQRTNTSSRGPFQDG
jgi:hypothetical protein